ncbi:hypothetical protein D8674_015063 [Pyrus ussuriensis x Pyrus communis]|uniref:Uncharacterized protein n=1 Tax=Pyrus ussuriensis x Pyrus communis TaxID=2448454 RepID=A0A5N5H7S0_9ROSA|nr:hypothetical protein D8674_015063 [Pyrus ussuriensis x Pyrus communis]
MARETLTLVSRSLKRAVNKINLILLSFKLNRLRLASILGCCSSRASTRHCLSFNDRLGLYSCIEDENTSTDGNQRSLRRVQSTRARDLPKDQSLDDHDGDDDDLDRRADVFIANFHRQLMFERQVSLQLRYCRRDNF